MFLPHYHQKFKQKFYTTHKKPSICTASKKQQFQNRLKSQRDVWIRAAISELCLEELSGISWNVLKTIPRIILCIRADRGTLTSKFPSTTTCVCESLNVFFTLVFDIFSGRPLCYSIVLMLQTKVYFGWSTQLS